MLPFLLKKKDAGGSSGVIVKNRQPDETTEQDIDPNAGPEAAAQALLSAIEMKDVAGIAAALQDAFEMMEQQPHEEGPTNEDIE